MGGARVGVRVLGLEMGDHRGVVFGAQPFVLVDDVVAVMRAGGRVDGGTGCLAAAERGAAHPPTLVDTGARRPFAPARGSRASRSMCEDFCAPVAGA